MVLKVVEKETTRGALPGNRRKLGLRKSIFYTELSLRAQHMFAWKHCEWTIWLSVKFVIATIHRPIYNHMISSMN